MPKPLTDNSFIFETTRGSVLIEAKNPATLNALWGVAASNLAQQGVMGEHSSSHGFFTPNPGDGGRQGVGNVSKDDPNFQNPEGVGNNLADGGQGLHGLFQSLRLGPGLPPAAIESSLAPFLPQANNPNIVVTPLDFVL